MRKINLHLKNEIETVKLFDLMKTVVISKYQKCIYIFSSDRPVYKKYKVIEFLVYLYFKGIQILL